MVTRAEVLAAERAASGSEDDARRARGGMPTYVRQPTPAAPVVSREAVLAAEQASQREERGELAESFVRGAHQVANGIFMGYAPEVQGYFLQGPTAAIRAAMETEGGAGERWDAAIRAYGKRAPEAAAEEREFIGEGNQITRFVNEIGGGAAATAPVVSAVRNTATQAVTRSAPGAAVQGGTQRAIDRGATYGVNAAAGATYGSSQGETAGDRAVNATLGTVTALAGTAVGNRIAGLIQWATRGGRTPDQRALRLIERELTDAGVAPDEVTRVANRLTTQAPTEEVLGELLGESGQRLMRATASMGRGAGRSQASNALEARAVGRQGPRNSADPNRRGVTSIRDRVMNEAGRTFEPDAARAPRSYWDALDALKQSRAAQGADNYRAAYAAELDQAAVQAHLVPIMREARDAATSAARQLDTEVQRLIGQRSRASIQGANEEIARIDADLENVRAAASQMRAIADGQTPNAVNTRAIDYFQRGLQQAEQAAGRGSPEAGALASFRRGFNELADQIAPALGDTRSQYGRSMAIEDFMDMGRGVFQMSDGELDRALRGANGQGLSMEEFDGFQLGVLDAVENKLGQGDTAFLARLARNQNWRDLLTRAAGGTAGARRFMDRLAREASMQQTRNFVLSGSRTQPLAEDIAALTDGESELAFLGDNARQLIASGGQLRPLVTRWLVGIYDRFNRPGLRDPAVQEAMASRLFSRVTRDGAKELRDAIEAARRDAQVPEHVRRWMDRVSAGGAQTADRTVTGMER